MLMKIDINCDLGEGVLYHGKAVEASIMPYISSVNIACGFHAGDSMSMIQTIKLALQYGVGIGAHPGYNDKAGFGRRFVPLSHNAIKTLVKSQVIDLRKQLDQLGGHLQHIKAHGALYNAAMLDQTIANALAEAIAETDETLILFGLPDSALQQAAQTLGLEFAAEAFADRAYNDDGSLVDRSIPGALIHDTDKLIEQCLHIVTTQKVKSINGNWIPLFTDTICLHGDSPQTPKIAMKLETALLDEGITIRPIGMK
jgi:5-oxoprolinase (ATP-hydrolysing) subunit A